MISARSVGDERDFFWISTRFALNPKILIFAARIQRWSRSSMDRIPACRQAGKFPKLKEGNSEVKMIGVYAIRSLVNGDIYVGIAKDVDARIKEHNKGKSRYTKGLKPWKEIYREEQADWVSAREREKKLKSGIGKEFLKSLVP